MVLQIYSSGHLNKLCINKVFSFCSVLNCLTVQHYCSWGLPAHHFAYKIDVHVDLKYCICLGVCLSFMTAHPGLLKSVIPFCSPLEHYLPSNWCLLKIPGRYAHCIEVLQSPAVLQYTPNRLRVSDAQREVANPVRI